MLNYTKKKQERCSMNDGTFIIFGATGDLAKRKLIPALYQLVAKKKLNNFAIIGALF